MTYECFEIMMKNLKKDIFTCLGAFLLEPLMDRGDPGINDAPLTEYHKIMIFWLDVSACKDLGVTLRNWLQTFELNNHPHIYVDIKKTFCRSWVSIEGCYE